MRSKYLRLNTKKSISLLLGVWTFLLLLTVKGVFPKAAHAFVSSLDACAAKPECAAAISSELAPAIATPTPAGVGASISTTTATGASTTVKAAANIAVVGDMRLSGAAAFHIWNQARNGQAQEKARQRYCAAYPSDVVCGSLGGQDAVQYEVEAYVAYAIGHGGKVHHRFKSFFKGRVFGSIKAKPATYPTPPFGGFRHYHAAFPVIGHGGNEYYIPFVGDDRKSDYYTSDYSYNWIENGGITSVTRVDGQPDTTKVPPIPWKDWSQEKRSTAVALLKNPDWLEFIKEMPVGRVLNPGDEVKAPGGIIIPGKLEDNPNTPADERLPKKQPDFTNPGGLDTDFDKDGTPDSADSEPQNPNVPTASSDPPNPPDEESEPLEDWQTGDALSENQRAQIDPAKFERFSMDPNNPNNGGKWKGFEDIGYDVQNEQGRSQGAQDVIAQLRGELPSEPAIEQPPTGFGRRFQVRTHTTGPNGKTATLVSTWQYDTGSNIPRLITNWIEVHN